MYFTFALCLASRLRRNWRKDYAHLPIAQRVAAFTLIEMSIVLVIVALLIGGVLVGDDMYKMSQARAHMSEMEKYQVAANTFRLKYNCIAGDCANATTLGLGPNGNADKIIEGIPTPGFGCIWHPTESCLGRKAKGAVGNTPTFRAYIGENQYFWVHLASAGLIPGSYSELLQDSWSAVPDNELGNYYPKDVTGKAYLLTFTWNSRFYIRTGLSNVVGSKSPLFMAAPFSAAQLDYITSKYDYEPIIGITNEYWDSLAARQKIVALGVRTEGSLNNILLQATAGFPSQGFRPCVVSDGAGGYEYNIADNGNCNLMWEMDY